MVFAHGSTVASANDAVHAVTAELARRTGDLVETAFLDCAPPNWLTRWGLLQPRASPGIVAIPYFLTLGIHLKRDLPRIADELRGIYQGVSIEITEPLDGHPALLEILIDRWKQARG